MKCPYCDGTGSIPLEGVTTGTLIASARKTRGWSQQQLADAIGVSRSHVFKVENGRGDISLKALRRLADALQTTLKELIP